MLPLSSARRLGFGGGGEADAGRSREAEEEAESDEATNQGNKGKAAAGRDSPAGIWAKTAQPNWPKRPNNKTIPREFSDPSAAAEL
jgi:hypothetical protein